MNIYILLKVINLTDFNLDHEELNEALAEFGCYPIALDSTNYLIASKYLRSIQNLTNIHEEYHGVIVEVNRFII